MSTAYSQSPFDTRKTTLVKKLMHIYDENTAKKLTLRALLQNPSTREIWSQSASNEYGRLLNGNDNGIKGTNTIEMIHPHNIPVVFTIYNRDMIIQFRYILLLSAIIA